MTAIQGGNDKAEEEWSDNEDIKLQGVRNIRDFSEYGFPGQIRSAHLHDMTERGMVPVGEGDR